MSILIQSCNDIDTMRKHLDLHSDTIHYYDTKYKDYKEGTMDSTLSTCLLDKKNKDEYISIEWKKLFEKESRRRCKLAMELSFEIAHSTTITDYLIKEIEKKQEQYEALKTIYGD